VVHRVVISGGNLATTWPHLVFFIVPWPQLQIIQ
jgi:hypothetical protein